MAATKTHAEPQTKAAPAPTTAKQPDTPEKRLGPRHAPVQRAAADALPPPDGAPAAARGADMLAATEHGGGAASRARLMRAMQGSVGNARVSRMLATADHESAGRPPAHSQAAPLTVGRPDSPAEKEAEAVARRVAANQPAPPVASLSHPTLQRSPTAEPATDDMPGKAAPPTRQPAPHEARREATAPDGDPVPVAGRQAAAQAMASKGAGSPVGQPLRREMEPRLGADLSQARVHADGGAQEAAHALNARAFTHGQDIYLGRGQSEHDKALMAHELTHVAQNQPSAQRAAQPTAAPPAAKDTPKPAGKEAADKAKPAADVAPGVVDLKQTPLTLPAETAAYVEAHKEAVIQAQFGKLAAGSIRLRKTRQGYEAKPHQLPLQHPLFAAGGVAAALEPQLQVEIKRSRLEGKIVVAGASLAKTIQQTPEAIGLPGFQFPSAPTLTNSISEGQLKVELKGVKIQLGAAFDGTVDIEAADEHITTFAAAATIQVRGLQSGPLELKRDESGVLTGKASLQAQLTKNVNGTVDVAWDGRAVTGQGKLGYQGEKLSGEMTVNLMEKAEAERLKREKQPPSKEGEEAKAPVAAAMPKKKGAKVDYAVFGEGDLNFAFTDWLTGTAHVILDYEGHATIIGKITPQKEFILFEQKDYVKPLPKLEARAAYGIPVIGNIFIFANVGLDLFAKLGPGKFYKIEVSGTYSTDPGISKDFRIQGTFNVSAAAGLRLRGEAGAGLEILAHDIKAGAGVNGIAGIRGYAEATPIVGYREKAQGAEDKKGEFFIRGELEMAAQPFLGLSGDLFIEIDAPWWSPVPDKKWTWELGSKEWPIGGSLGMKASVDYVFGSKQWPTVDFQSADFSADKFFTDLYHDKAKPKSGEGPDQKGKWSEQNSPQAEPPTGGGKGAVAASKAPPAAPPAQPKVKPGGAKKGAKDVDPNAKTADGKTVKQHQEEATKKGKGAKKADDKAVPKGASKQDKAEKDKGKQEHDKDLEAGLAALDAVTARYAKDGAMKEEVVTGVKAVRRKFKAFKSIEVIEGAETWDYEYVVNPRDRKTGPKKAMSGKAGRIDYGSIDQSGRRSGVRATITRQMLGKGSAASRSIRPPGFLGGEANHARGHLLGRQLGGSGIVPENLVTLYQNPANSPYMRDIENRVRDAVAKGEVIDYSSTPIYVPGQELPAGVTIKAVGDKGFNLYISVANHGKVAI